MYKLQIAGPSLVTYDLPVALQCVPRVPSGGNVFHSYTAALLSIVVQVLSCMHVRTTSSYP